MIIALALTAAIAATPQRREESLRSFVQAEFREVRDDLRGNGYGPDIQYHAAFTDLNGDGRDEAIVYVTGKDMCGSGGCELEIYTPRGASWREVTSLSVTRPPIRLLASKSHGWRDLGVFVAGGGIIPGYDVQLRFDGRTYPTNPTAPPARPLRKRKASRVLIDADAKGRPLF